MTRLEDVLDIPAHARVRWYLTPEFCTLAGIQSEIRDLVPQFPLWDEEHQRAWARVAHTLTGGTVDAGELTCIYRDYVLFGEKLLGKEFEEAPPTAEIWAPSTSGGEVRVETIEHTVEPAELARRCAMIGPRARFVLRGLGRYIRGSARGWRRLCRHGRVLCTWCGTAVPNRRRWYSTYGPELWPWVGLVPGSRWHRAPGRRRP